MDARQLVDEIADALQSHPDEFWARRAAAERVREFLAGICVGCPFCGGDVQLLEDDA